MILSTNRCTFKKGTTKERIASMKELGFTGAGAANIPDSEDRDWEGFDLLAVHAPFINLDLLSDDVDARMLAKQKCLDCLEWSAGVGAETVTLHPGGPGSDACDERVDQRMKNLMLQFDRRADRLGIWACWETGTGYFVPLKKFEVIRELKLRRTGICLDSGHLERVWRQISVGDEIGTFPAFIRRFKDLIKCTHLHDWIDEPPRADGWQDHHMIGRGSIDWHEFFSLLVEIGYNGDLLLEYHPDSYETFDELKENLAELRHTALVAGAEIG